HRLRSGDPPHARGRSRAWPALALFHEHALVAACPLGALVTGHGGDYGPLRLAFRPDRGHGAGDRPFRAWALSECAQRDAQLDLLSHRCPAAAAPARQRHGRMVYNFLQVHRRPELHPILLYARALSGDVALRGRDTGWAAPRARADAART